MRSLVNRPAWSLVHLAAVVVVAAVGLLMSAPNASAAAAYPPQPCPSLSVSTTTPPPGGTITIVGSHFASDTPVQLELHPSGRVLASVVSDGRGSFTTAVTLPSGLHGTQRIAAVTTPPLASGCSPSVTFTIGQLGGAHQESGGSTAFTGTDVLAIVAAGAAILGVGLVLTRGGRRRRTTTAPRP